MKQYLETPNSIYKVQLYLTKIANRIGTKHLVVISFLVIISKIAIWSLNLKHPEVFMSNDSYSYLATAKNPWEGYFSTPNQFYDQRLRIVPGYPVFIFLLSWLDIKYFYLLSSLIPIAVGAVFYKTFSKELPQTSKLTYLFLILDPALYFESFKVLSDSFFLLLMVLIIYFTKKCISEKSYKYSVFAGLIFGYSVLVRPIAYYLPFIALIIFAATRSEHFKRILVLTLIAIVIPTAWIGKNYYEYGVPILSSVQGTNLIIGEVAGVRALAESKSYEEIISEEDKLKGAQLPRDATAKQIYQYDVSRAKNVLPDHPIELLKLHIIGFAKILFGPGKMTISELLPFMPFFATKFVIYLSSIISILLGLFSLIAISIYFYSSKAFFLLSTYELYFLVLASGSTAYSRFRIPISPIIFLLGFILLLGEKYQKNNK